MERLHRALEALPDKQKEVIRLRYLEGRRVGDIAQQLEDAQERPDFTFTEASRLHSELNRTVDQVITVANEYLASQA